MSAMTPKQVSFALFLAGLLSAATPVLAAPAIERAGDKPRYDNCLALSGADPAAALGVAGKWAKEGGGAPAEHCAALALVGLKRYAEAGARLDTLGRAPDVGNLRASLLDQAGNAWLLAGDVPHATASFQAALTLSGNDPDLYADLARAQALGKDWRGVESDLNAALAITPRRADLLVLRASARQALGKPSAARDDLSQAFKLGVSGETADAARRLRDALDSAAQPPPAAKSAPMAKKPPATRPAH